MSGFTSVCSTSGLGIRARAMQETSESIAGNIVGIRPTAFLFKVRLVTMQDTTRPECCIIF